MIGMALMGNCESFNYMKGGMIMVQLNSVGDDKNQKELFITGKSTDEKPTRWKGSRIPQFSIYYEIDTGHFYVFDIENMEWLQRG